MTQKQELIQIVLFIEENAWNIHYLRVSKYNM